MYNDGGRSGKKRSVCMKTKCSEEKKIGYIYINHKKIPYRLQMTGYPFPDSDMYTANSLYDELMVPLKKKFVI